MDNQSNPIQNKPPQPKAPVTPQPGGLTNQTPAVGPQPTVNPRPAGQQAPPPPPAAPAMPQPAPRPNPVQSNAPVVTSSPPVGMPESPKPQTNPVAMPKPNPPVVPTTPQQPQPTPTAPAPKTLPNMPPPQSPPVSASQPTLSTPMPQPAAAANPTPVVGAANQNPVAPPPQPMPTPNFGPNTPSSTGTVGVNQPTPETPSLNAQGNNKPKGSSPLGKIIAILIGLLIVVGGGLGAYFYLTNSNGKNDPIGPRQNGGKQQVGLVPSGQTVTIEYLGLWETETVLRPIFDEFEAQNPGLTIKYTQDSPKDYRERLESALARGEGPDVFRIHNTWVPMFRNKLAGMPNSVMTVAEYQQTFYPVIANDMLSDNAIVGMPLMIDGLGLYYNTSMFSTAGKQPPTTWDELRRTAVDLTITENGEVERAGIALGLASNVDSFSDILGLMLLQNGANPADPTTSLAQDAVNFYTIFSKTDRIWNDKLPPSTFAFATEKTAMMIAPSWRAHEVVALNPDLEFAVATLPQLPDRDVSWATYWVESVSNQSQHPEIAWALLKFMTEKESLRTMYTQASSERFFGNPFPRVDMASQLIGDPYVGAFIQQAPIAESWPMASRTFDNGINDRIIKYYEDMINAGPSPQSLQTVSSGVTQVLSHYGVNPK